MPLHPLFKASPRLRDNSLRILREISGLGSVTGSEFRLYRWIHRWLDTYGTKDPRLQVTHIADSQLLVSWDGSETQGPRLTIIAHADHEGYRVVGTRADAADTVTLIGQPVAPALGEVELNHTGATVCLELNGETHTFASRIERTDSKGCIEVDLHVDPGLLAAPSRDLQAVIQHRFDIPDWELDEDPNEQPGQQIQAAYIDNCAGVAVSLATLGEIARAELPVNVGVLLTSGEEAGFIGMQEVIRSDTQAARALMDSVCIVVDSSDVERSIREPLGAWNRRLAKNGRHPEKRRICPRECVAIRLGDKWTHYDPGVARLLYQAAIGVRATLGPEAEALVAPLGVSGEFVGGICEASALAMAPQIRARHNLDPGSGVHIGALAIPIENYRNIPATIRGQPHAETTTLGALHTAALSLFNLAHSMPFWPAFPAGRARQRDQQEIRRLERRGDETESPPIDILARLDEWVEEGRPLIESLRGYLAAAQR